MSILTPPVDPEANSAHTGISFPYFFAKDRLENSKAGSTSGALGGHGKESRTNLNRTCLLLVFLDRRKSVMIWTYPAYAGISRATVTQYPRIIPFRKPQSLHISLMTPPKRLSVTAPYCPCILTLNISTSIQSVGNRQEEYPAWLTRTRKYSIGCPCHSTCNSYLFQWKIGKGRDDSFWSAIGSEKERVDTSNPEKGT